MAALKVPGNKEKCEVFHQKTLVPFWQIHGENELKPLMNAPGLCRVAGYVYPFQATMVHIVNFLSDMPKNGFESGISQLHDYI